MTSPSPVKTLRIAMNGITGRMGYRQHLLRSILPIRDQGGVLLEDGTRIQVEPILLGRNADKVRELAALHGVESWSTDPDSLIHAFGVSLGDLVAHRVPGLLWGSARSDGAPELVLTHPEVDLVVFPVAAVAKSWGEAPVGWVAEYVEEASTGALEIIAGAHQPH